MLGIKVNKTSREKTEQKSVFTTKTIRVRSNATHVPGLVPGRANVCLDSKVCARVCVRVQIDHGLQSATDVCFDSAASCVLWLGIERNGRREKARMYASTLLVPPPAIEFELAVYFLSQKLSHIEQNYLR